MCDVGHHFCDTPQLSTWTTTFCQPPHPRCRPVGLCGHTTRQDDNCDMTRHNHHYQYQFVGHQHGSGGGGSGNGEWWVFLKVLRYDARSDEGECWVQRVQGGSPLLLSPYFGLKHHPGTASSSSSVGSNVGGWSEGLIVLCCQCWVRDDSDGLSCPLALNYMRFIAYLLQ